MRTQLLRQLQLGGSTLALIAATSGFSSAALAQDQPSAEAMETVVVSSTRITTAGFNAPTPTTVVGAADIQNQAKDNIFNVVTELPSMMGSTGQQTGANGTSGGTNGLSSFNMFGLGTTRTLTLLDGERVAPANVTGVPDISEFPQLLIQRVDVVTGGASASWGSDAIAGVVNFITDKNFTGFKANLEGGLSTYGDNGTGTAQAAAGTDFAGGRGHIEVAGEFSHSDGVGAGLQLGCCTTSLPNGRTWFTEPTLLEYSTPAATPAGQPQYFNTPLGQQYQLGRYGLITTGPLQGTAFGNNGTTYQFNYGYGPNGLQGVPQKNAAGTVSNCIAPFCIGGETDGMEGSGVTLAIPLTRGDFYTRVSYDVTPDINVFATLNLSQVGTSNIPNPDAWLSSLPGIPANSVGQVTQAANIQCGNAPGGPNAYLPASINQACIANGITSFGFGSDYDNLGPQTVYTQRDQRRLVVGANGAYSMFGNDWTWDTYFEHGENGTNIHVRYITLKPNLYAAIDSVAEPDGTIVCRSTVAQAEGCIPFDPFGDVTPTAAQLNWLYGGTQYGPGPFQLSHQKQDAFSINTSGSPFSDWAGKVSIATGFDYRQEGYNVIGDSAGDGNVQVDNIPLANTCTDPLLNCVSGTNWYAGSFHNGAGNYHVVEGFVETGVPIINDDTWGKADLDVAGRMESYSTSGQAITWKIGATWDTPIDGVRFRALQSRDVRAPNLAELFAAPTTANGTSNDPWNSGQQLQVIQGTLGNPNLKPEKSQNTQVGVVFQPSWLPGFSTSVDYYRIGLKGQVASVSQQNEINECYAGLTQYCSAIVVAGGASPATSTAWTQVNSEAFNLASTVTDGFNIESSYQFALDDWGMPGNFIARALATNVTKFISTAGVPGTYPIESAGANDGNTPNWKIFGTQTYNADSDKWSLTLSETWISEGVHNRSWIQCAVGSCPVPTLQNPTINDNHVPGEFYINIGGTYSLSDTIQTYFEIDNALNKSPPPYPANSQNPTGDGANAELYDLIGRMYHVGIRVNL